ncbi:MAG: hypothetical protein WD534_09360 [Phycisphaeraceae bacterium]
MTFIMSPVLSGLLLLLAVALFIWGWRGRRVGDHPICRACGYDLHGLQSDHASCPECGADITRTRAVQIGRRRRRRTPLIAAALLLPLGILTALPLVTAFDLDAYKPVWLLRYEAQAGGMPALEELTRRLDVGELSQAQVDAVVGTALATQADRSRPWEPAWGEFVERAQLAGVLTQADLETYVRQALDDGGMVLEVRPQVRRGDPVAYRIKTVDVRASASDHFWLITHREPLRLGEWTGHRIRSSSGGSFTASISGWSGLSWSLSEEILADIQPGVHTLELDMRAELFKLGPYGGQQGSALVDVSFTLSGQWELVEAQTPGVTLTSEPSLRVAVEQAFANPRLRLDSSTGNLWGRVDVNSPPTGLAFEAAIRNDGQLWPLNAVTVAAGRTTGYGLSRWEPVEGLAEGDRVDLVFTPYVDAALRTTDIFEIWGEAVVIEDVEIESRP